MSKIATKKKWITRLLEILGSNPEGLERGKIILQLRTEGCVVSERTVSNWLAEIVHKKKVRLKCGSYSLKEKRVKGDTKCKTRDEKDKEYLDLVSSQDTYSKKSRPSRPRRVKFSGR